MVSRDGGPDSAARLPGWSPGSATDLGLVAWPPHTGSASGQTALVAPRRDAAPAHCPSGLQSHDERGASGMPPLLPQSFVHSPKASLVSTPVTHTFFISPCSKAPARQTITKLIPIGVGSLPRYPRDGFSTVL